MIESAFHDFRRTIHSAKSEKAHIWVKNEGFLSRLPRAYSLSLHTACKTKVVLEVSLLADPHDSDIRCKLCQRIASRSPGE